MQHPRPKHSCLPALCASRGLLLLSLALVPFGHTQMAPDDKSGGAIVGAAQLQTYPTSATGAAGSPSPSEYSAYAAALSTTPALAQAAALRRFIEAYPQSSLAPAARKWLVSARAREANEQGKPPTAVRAVPAASSAASSPAPPVPQQVYRRPASQLGHRAVLDLGPHTLTVAANNSSLFDILHELSLFSGMKVEGLSHDERIYGSFGPGEPQDVLNSLLGGLGYNILMIGEESRGMPRELILSPRTGGTATASTGVPHQAGDADQDDEAMQDEQSPGPEVQPTQGRPFTPPPPQTGPGPNGRTTQDMLEELRRLHPQVPPPPPDPSQ